jgi:hypothetical protein
MNTHTPRPWRAVGDAMKVFAGNMTICDIRGWGYLTGVGGLQLSEADAIAIQRANTRLIVAAPDLLALLKRYIANHCADADAEGMSTLCECAVCMDARAAIGAIESEARDEE